MIKQFKRKSSPNIEAWYWMGQKLPDRIPNWVRGMCRVVTHDVGSGQFTLTVDTKTGIAKSFGPCWVIRESDNAGAYPIDNNTFQQHYTRVII